MFVDEAKISVTAGKGGDGCVSFRKEKYVPKGGPDGGNGGRGGNIIFEAVDNAHTLYDFRSRKVFKADNGRPGSGSNCNGKYGADLTLKVPVGTQIRDAETGRILADLIENGQQTIIAKGGIGGKGNAGFVSSIRQAPDFAEKGDIGETKNLELELKLVADVALVGYPSVGKSTFISVISNAKPKIAEYHFTTLVPNLGVAKIEDRELVFIDVPGLIEGASEGKGLGHEFLRHIERARFVIQLIDVTSDTPFQDYEIIRKELEKFSHKLAQKPFVPVFTKIDLTDKELETFLGDEFEKKYHIRPFFISPATHEGLDGLLRFVSSQVPKLTTEEFREVFSEKPTVDAPENTVSLSEEEEGMVTFRPAQDKTVDERTIIIEQTSHWWNLKNEKLEQMVRQTDVTNEAARYRIYDLLGRWHVLKKLEKQGAKPGDLIRIGEQFWDYKG